MSKTNLGLTNPEWSETAVGSFIIPEYIDVPYTTIVNRAQILDESKTIKVLAPVERINIMELKLIDEYDINDKAVYATNDPRIRFINNWTYRSIVYGGHAFVPQM